MSHPCLPGRQRHTRPQLFPSILAAPAPSQSEAEEEEEAGAGRVLVARVRGGLAAPAFHPSSPPPDDPWYLGSQDRICVST